MRGAGLSLTLVLLLTGCAPGEAARGVECPAFAAVERNVPPPHLNDDPNDERLEAVWKRWADTDPGIGSQTARADTTVRLSSAPGMTPNPTHHEIVARRTDERWEVHAKSGGNNYPQIAWKPWKTTTLSPRAAARLDALLASPCLWEAPPFLNDIVRLKNGRHDFRPDGPSTMYDITSRGKHWGGWQLSWTVGPPGEIRNLLIAEVFGEREYPVDQIDPAGQLDERQVVSQP